MFRIYVLALACFLVAALGAATLQRAAARVERIEAARAVKAARSAGPAGPTGLCATSSERRWVRCSTPS